MALEKCRPTGLTVAMACIVLALTGVPAFSADPKPPDDLRVIDEDDFAFFPGDYSNQGVIGQRFPGTWRPFGQDSPWNTPIPANAAVHPDSGEIMGVVMSEADHLRFGNSYLPPIWVVNGTNVTPVRVRSDRIFDWWDEDRDGWSDIGIPVTPEMWGEPTSDGHIIIIDPFKLLSYEMSKFGRMVDGTPTSTTFNVWNITGSGVGDSSEGNRWGARGGRGSGFPVIAGLIRPEEIAAGEIRHALAFTFTLNRRASDGSNMFIPPACRSDGRQVGSQYPVEGMRFQLDPALTDEDFESWGLTDEGKVVARALQRYGMYDGDNGGAMAVQIQLLAESPSESRQIYDSLFPGFYKNVEKIPTDRLRVVYTGEPILKR